MVKQKCRKPAKTIPKKKRQDLLKSLRSVDLNSLQAEIRMAVEEQFEDSNLCAFINELFKDCAQACFIVLKYTMVSCQVKRNLCLLF